MKSTSSNKTIELWTKLDKKNLVSNLFPKKFTANFIDSSANFTSILIFAVEANQAIDRIPKKPSVCFNSVQADK